MARSTAGMQRDDRKDADKPHMQSRRRLAPPPDAIESRRLDDDHDEQDADEHDIGDEKRQEPVVGRGKNAEFGGDKKGRQGTADGADSYDRTNQARAPAPVPPSRRVFSAVGSMQAL